MEVSWAAVKSHISAKSLRPQYLDLDDVYYVCVFDGPFRLACTLAKGSDDAVEFESTYQADCNKKIVPRTVESGALLSANIEPEGQFETYISHDWCDKTTWFQESVRVFGGGFDSVVDLTYQLPNGYIIDLTHGKYTNEDKIADQYEIKAYDDAVEVDIASIDYLLGKITLASAPSGTVTFDYSYATTSTWTMSYEDGFILRINKAEVQFTKDVNFRPMEFSVWITHPIYGDLKVDSVKYKSIKDIVNISNLGFCVPAFADLENEVVIFPFNYQRPIDVTAQLQMRVKLMIVDHEPMTGEFATASLYVAEIPA